METLSLYKHSVYGM